MSGRFLGFRHSLLVWRLENLAQVAVADVFSSSSSLMYRDWGKSTATTTQIETDLVNQIFA